MIYNHIDLFADVELLRAYYITYVFNSRYFSKNKDTRSKPKVVSGLRFGTGLFQTGGSLFKHILYPGLKGQKGRTIYHV